MPSLIAGHQNLHEVNLKKGIEGMSWVFIYVKILSFLNEIANMIISSRSSFFAYGYLIVPAPFTGLLLMQYLWPFIKNLFHVWVGLLQDFLVCSIDPFVYLCQYHAILSININPPNLLFFLKVILVIWGPLNVQINFRISLSISTKKKRLLGFWLGLY